MYDNIHEPIEVDAAFVPGKIIIKGFVWNSKNYEVQGIHLVSRARRGRDPVWLFSLSTENEAFKLRFDSATLQWFLEEYVWDEVEFARMRHA